MTAKDKQRAIIAGSVIVTAVFLWLLLKHGTGTRVIASAGSTAPLPRAGTVGGISSVPPFNLNMGDHTYVSGSKGCLMCYSGYQRIETPTPAPVYMPPPITVVNNYAPPYPNPGIMLGGSAQTYWG